MNEFHWVLFDSLRTIIPQDNIVITYAEPNKYMASYTIKTVRGQFVCLIRRESQIGRIIFDIKVHENWIPYFPREYAQELFERTEDEYTRRQEIAAWDKIEINTVKFLNKIRQK